MTDLRSTIESQLENFQTLELRPAALALLETLGYKIDKTMELDGSPAAFLELYFPEEAAEKDLLFMDQVSALLNVPQASRLPTPAENGRRDACDTEAFVASANAPSHPIRNQLLRLTAECESAHAPSNFFAVIKQEAAV